MNQVPTDVIGVIASFLPSTTRHQRRLMLVNHTWHQGTISHDDMQPKPNICWSLEAMSQRQPRKVRLMDGCTVETLGHLALVDREHGPFVESLDLRNTGSDFVAQDTTNRQVSDFKRLSCLRCATYPFEYTNTILRELSVLDSSSLYDIDMLSMCTAFPNLAVLRLGNCVKLTDEGLASIAERLHALRVLDIAACENLTDESLALFANQLEHLTELHCSNKNITSDGLRLLTTKAGAPLTALRIEGEARANAMPNSPFGQFTALTKLQISGLNVDFPTDGESPHQIPIEQLDLQWCNVPTGIATVCYASTHLTTLSMVGVQFGNDHMEDLCMSPCRHSLTSLNISHNSDLTNAGVVCIAEEFPKLRELKLQFCRFLGNVGVENLSELSCLTTLSLEGCQALTDVGVAFICRCKSLTNLNMSQCRRITNSGLQLVGTHLPRLRHLVLRSCGGESITDDGVRHLVNLTRLTHLDLSSASLVTKAAVSRLVTSLPLLEVLLVPVVIR